VGGSGGVAAGGTGGSIPGPCQLDVVGGQQLPPGELAPSVFDGPVPVSTDTRFVLVWREISANAAAMHLGRVEDSGLLSSTAKDKAPYCPGTPAASSGISAAWNPISKVGMLASATPECSNQGATLVAEQFTEQGLPTFATQWAPMAYELALQNVNGAAARPGDTGFVVAVLEKSWGPESVPAFWDYDLESQTATYSTDIPSMSTAAKFVRVAMTSQITAALFNDTHANGAVHFWVSPNNGAGVISEMEPARVGALAVTGDRAMAVIAVQDALQWQVRSSDGTIIKDGVIAGPQATAVGAVALHDYFIVAAARLGGVSLYRFDNATGALSSSPGHVASLSAGAPGVHLDGFDGTMFSMAAGRDAVMLSWLYGSSPADAAPGAYAVLRCGL
jgi:hypothetical protein